MMDALPARCVCALKPILAAALLVWTTTATAAPAPESTRDRAGNRLEPLVESKDAASNTDADDAAVGPRYCTTDGTWCLRLRRHPEASGQAPWLEVAQRVAGEAEPRYRHVAYAGVDGPSSLRIWPWLLRLAPGAGLPSVPRDPVQAAQESVLVGVEREQQTAYAGGGASSSALMLEQIYPTDDGTQTRSVLELPLGGSASIRACFGERDTALRRGACHDEYGFSAELGLAASAQGMPVLRYATHATRFPAFASRHQDSLARGQLSDKDLRTATDPICSYQRELRFEQGRYVPGTALPDCSEFTGL